MTPLEKKIAREIASYGPMPFARFMELALYCPVYGYYEKEEDKLGKAGDYYTSVNVGPVFGHLLAWQFCRWWRDTGTGKSEPKIHLVEAGAHHGQLAGDILDWLRCQRPEVFQRVTYTIIENSTVREGAQRAKLKAFEPKVQWIKHVDDLAGTLEGAPAIVFCNELLDALPAHRWFWNSQERRWVEWGVTTEADRFRWEPLPGGRVVPDALCRLPPQLTEILPDRFTIDLCPAAEEWWARAARSMRSGILVAFDYGGSIEDLLQPHRAAGTLRGYYRHNYTANVLEDAGEQDLTAHVNFTAISEAGERCGFKTIACVSQDRFLTGVLEQALGEPSAFGAWGQREANQFRTLASPEGLGRALKVLIQQRIQER